LLHAVKGSSNIGAIGTMILSHSNRRKLLNCTAGFTFNACANCCGYKFTDDGTIYDAVEEYHNNDTITTYGEMNCWDVSSITNMSQLFTYYYNWFTFNEPIGCWNVSKVTDMSEMFDGVTNFNQDR